MGSEHSRRQFLGTGLVGTGLLGIGPSLGAAGGLDDGLDGGLGDRSRDADDLSNELRFESDGGGFGSYEFTVSGKLRQVDDDDHVDGNRAWGHVGPERGTDTYRYSGELTGVVLAGPATVFRNGTRIRLGGFPHPEGSLTSANFDADDGANVLRIESDGGGVAAYEFAVTGSVDQRDDDDHVEGNRAWGHVGPERGTDEFEFTGEVTRFELAGPASAFLNGSEVTAESDGGDRGLLRAGPDREVTAVPGTTILFEAVAPDYADEFLYADWYVDGQQYVSPGTFHGQLGGRGRVTTTDRFESGGTHEVRVDAYERLDSGEWGAHVGSTAWTVSVGADGNRAPAVELVRPESPIAVSRESPERRAFEVAASDPEGELDRVVWWESQCDYVVAVDAVDGGTDGAALSHAPNAGCPLGVRAIDENGAVSDLRGWTYERED